MLNVLLTVDTEVYPLHCDWRRDGLTRDVRRDIYAETDQGAYGLSYQIEQFRSHGLKACFFVEGLFASAVSRTFLDAIVREVQDGGHEVQLHLHPEWLEWMPEPLVPKDGRETIRCYSRSEQAQLIGAALQNLRNAGAKGICAFRAGDYAANGETLRALCDHGITCDTSYNACYADSLRDVPDAAGTVQARRILGLWEFPVAVWQDCTGHRRHAQVCSCSTGEMKAALNAAWRAGWHWFVIVSHSFELLKKRRQNVARPAADTLVVRRFQELCRFLAQNNNRFRTCGFNDLDMSANPAPETNRPLQVPLRHTFWRRVEQVYRRLT